MDPPTPHLSCPSSPQVREHVNSIEDVRAAPMQRDCPKQANVYS